MRAWTTKPGEAGSTRVKEIAEPQAADGDVLVEALALGVCGTDIEIILGEYGWAPPGRQRLVLGRESLGRVLEAPRSCGILVRDLVAGVVRHPDPDSCRNCALWR
jgi:threonine dehydrogenase-like Zn-dependent dehydrogenase